MPWLETLEISAKTQPKGSQNELARMIIPAPSPDETFHSLLARLGRLNGIADLRDIATTCFGVRACASFVDGRFALPQFCEQIKYAYGTPEEVLERFSYFTLSTKLGELSPYLIGDIAAGKRQTNLAELACGNVGLLRWCPTCVEEDIDTCGVAYWHRIHQPFFVRTCDQHGAQLEVMQVARAKLHSNLPLPGDVAADRSVGQPFAWSKPALLQGVSKVINVAAESDILLSSDDVVATIRLELCARGLLSQRGRVLQQEVVECLTEVIGATYSCEVSALKRLAMGIVRGFTEPSKNVALGHVVLIQWLFGGWDAFAEKCRWVQALGYLPELGDPDVPAATEATARCHHRKICMDYVQAYPSGTRFSFTKKQYRSFRWLLHHDKEWLDHQLPVLVSESHQLCLF